MTHLKTPPTQSFEESVTALQQRAEREPVYIKTLFEVFGGRGFPLIIMMLSIPFCQPLQIPGFSTPFGLLIAFLGLRFVFNHKILLPQSILEKPLSKEFIDKLFVRSLWVLQKIKRFSHPRLVVLSKQPFMYALNGVLTCLLGLLLALPLPIPLTNIISGWSLLLLHFGLLEDDGLFIIAGYILTAICIGFFVAIFSLI